MKEIDRFHSVIKDETYILIDFCSMHPVGIVSKEHKDKVNVIINALKQSYGQTVKVDLCNCGQQFKPIAWAKCFSCRKKT